jgi:hypothetical protein
MQKKLSIVAIAAVIAAVFATTLAIKLTVQSANACSPPKPITFTNPPQSVTACSNTHAIAGDIAGRPNSADNNKQNNHAFTGGEAATCAFTPKAGQVCAP